MKTSDSEKPAMGGTNPTRGEDARRSYPRAEPLARLPRVLRERDRREDRIEEDERGERDDDEGDRDRQVRSRPRPRQVQRREVPRHIGQRQDEERHDRQHVEEELWPRHEEP